ncbi:MAG: GNAT family N-acetyltransferase [Clostridia bacterium]
MIIIATREMAQKYVDSVGSVAVNLAGFLAANDDIDIFSSTLGEGIMLRGERHTLLYSKRFDVIDDFVASLSGQTVVFSCVEKNIANHIINGKATIWQNCCFVYTYDKSDIALKPMPQNVVVAPIYKNQIKRVNDNYTYKAFGSRKILYEKICARDSSAVYFNGQMVAWSLLHEDYSLGAMFVLPEFRRLGFATLVTENLVQKVLAKGVVPSVQIVCNNEASKNLANAIGFEKKFESYWFQLKC